MSSDWVEYEVFRCDCTNPEHGERCKRMSKGILRSTWGRGVGDLTYCGKCVANHNPPLHVLTPTKVVYVHRDPEPVIVRRFRLYDADDNLIGTQEITPRVMSTADTLSVSAMDAVRAELDVTA